MGNVYESLFSSRPHRAGENIPQTENKRQHNLVFALLLRCSTCMERARPLVPQLERGRRQVCWPPCTAGAGLDDNTLRRNPAVLPFCTTLLVRLPCLLFFFFLRITASVAFCCPVPKRRPVSSLKTRAFRTSSRSPARKIGGCSAK